MTEHSKMEDLTRNLPTKSEKIRTLGSAGYSRRQIADFLGIRYQHVRNVLVDQDRRTRSGFSENSAPSAEREPMPPAVPGRALLRADGAVLLPQDVVAAAGFKVGEPLLARVTGEGEVHVLSTRAAIRRAQDMVRQFVPENVSLVEDLLKERRREAARQRE
jgi:hypothetical protein